MDVNTLRITLMMIALVAFFGVAWWAYAPRHRGHFERLGRDILDDGEMDAADTAANHNKEGSRA